MDSDDHTGRKTDPFGKRGRSFRWQEPILLWERPAFFCAFWREGPPLCYSTKATVDL